MTNSFAPRRFHTRVTGRINACGLVLIGLTSGAAGQCEVDTVVASDAAPDGVLGTAVALDGDTAVIGANALRDLGSDEPGAAYIWERDGDTDVWTERAKLTPSDSSPADQFGYSVAISGDTVLVGAYANDSRGDNAGAAYVFERDQGGPDNWGEVVKLTGSSIAANDWFGWSVGIDDDTAVVGAPFHDDPADRAGKVFVFERDLGGSNQWGERTTMTASDASAVDELGWSVAVSGNTIIAGAIGTDDACGDAAECESGSAYLFGRNVGGANAWGELQVLDAADAETFDLFGISVSIDGDTAVVGAIWEDEAANDAGAAYVFQQAGSTWSQMAKLAALDAAAQDQLGWSVSLSGSYALVGRSFDLVSSCTDPGAAYVFHRDAGGPDAWGQLARLTSASSDEQDDFGEAVAIDGASGYACLGAPGNDSSGDNAGAASIFTLDDADCNSNGVCDAVDIATGVSQDSNGNGVPDECEDLCPADLDGSGAVDFPDLLTVLSTWGPCK